MTNKKISELTALGTTPASTDEFVLVDDDANETKKVTYANLGILTASSSDTFTNKTINDFTNFVGSDEVHIQARNESGSTMNLGDVVYISGYSVGQDLALVSLADADQGASAAPAIGLVEDTTIANNANGHIVIAGKLDGFDTSAFSVGDPAYLSATAGALSTKPTGKTQDVQKLGIILRSHASLGVMQIVGAGRVNDVPNDIAIAKLADGTDGELITWDASGNIATVAVGTSGQVLLSQGAGAAPVFAASGSSFESATGSFTGDGNATKALTGVGFQPDFVILNIMTIAGVGQFHKSSNDGTKTNSFSAPAVIGEYVDDLIISLDADGFTIGDGTGSTVGNAINTSSRVSRWEAFKWS